jgi:tetratricopeptide (TPR) repeat protein
VPSARLRAALGSFFALIAISAGSTAGAESAGEIAGAAADARDEAALAELAKRLSRLVASLDAAAPPPRLESTTDALGKLVLRAREVEVGEASFDRLLSLGRELGARTRAVREHLEERAGEDEDALEKLYRSDDWQRLDYSDAMLGYWMGWAQLSLGQALRASPERRAAMRAAEAAFARSALELRLPRIAVASLFGLGVARHDLGDLDGARRTLERVKRQIEGSGDGAMLHLVLYELAAIALEQGELERGRGLAARIPAGDLSREQHLGLMRVEAEAWLRRANAGEGGADAAAALLRQLVAEGGDTAQWAAGSIARHWSVLAGRDVGPLGDLLTAEAAFEAGRFAEARDAYARALADPAAVPGLEPATTRYKYARSLAESGGRSAAADELEKLLADGGGAPVRGPAAALLHVVAEEIADADPGPTADRRALRAAEILLRVAPDSPGAGIARHRVARAREASDGRRSTLAELAKIPASSPAYPAARLDMARLRSAQLQQLEASGQADTKAGRRAARALAEDLDAVQALITAGRLAPEPGRDATLAVFRAKAAAWSGDAASDVLARVEAAAALPGLEASDRRALDRLRFRALARAGRFAELARARDARSDSEIRRDWPLWREVLAQLEARPAPPETLLPWYARLEPLAPAASRDDLSLEYARALLAAGRADVAVPRARSLALADPSWGDAWILYARALDATGADEDAYLAWSKVAGGVETGSSRWVDATLAAAAAARRLGEPERACRDAAELERRAPDLSERQSAQLAGFAAACPPPTAGSEPRAEPARSDATHPPTDPR